MGRQLADVGEFGLIDRITRHVHRAARAGPDRGVALGIGDDAAILRLRPGEALAVSTDASVEDVHFSWKIDAPRSLGRRILAAALSDLAAMGARPVGCTLALAAPPALELRLLDGVLGGLVAEAAQRGCPLSGGNIARASETSFSLTVLGAVAPQRALRRGQARRGDVLCVTGVLGRAALARARAEATGRWNQDVPPDRLGVGRQMVRSGIRMACIDLSDGLSADLQHLLGASGGLGAEVDLSAVPCGRGFRQACARYGLEPDATLASGGEDYELLFSVPPEHADPTKWSKRLGVRVSRIGQVVSSPGVRGLESGGWRHF
jgi:thiamine-monophosphate kinase